MRYGSHRGLWRLDAAELLCILSIDSISMHTFLGDRYVGAVSNAFPCLNSKFSMRLLIVFEVSENKWAKSLESLSWEGTSSAKPTSDCVRRTDGEDLIRHHQAPRPRCWELEPRGHRYQHGAIL